MTGLLLLWSASMPAADQSAPPRTCATSSATEIVICGSHGGDSPYRMPRIAKDYKPKPIKAETEVAPGVSANSHVEAQGTADGKVSNRLMVSFKLKF